MFKFSSLCSKQGNSSFQTHRGAGLLQSGEAPSHLTSPDNEVPCTHRPSIWAGGAKGGGSEVTAWVLTPALPLLNNVNPDY